jgi:D-sedoheptulose 7-phosphate isomerase
MNLDEHFQSYRTRLTEAIQLIDPQALGSLSDEMRRCWHAGKRIYLCGNGGSAGNAIHLANDFTYGVGKVKGVGMRVEALPANSSVLTCLANDVGYEEVFSEQLRAKGEPGDLLVVFSGSGNSPNVVRALEQAKELGMKSFAILGFSGGRCKELADEAIHVQVDDMQVSEDIQLVIGHCLMQWLSVNSEF